MAVLLVHLAATLFMTGLIWFVQLVHYPMFSSVGRERFAEYEIVHSRRTAWVVVPAMLIEAITGVYLVVTPPTGVPRDVLWVGLGLIVMSWLSTALLQVPRHRKLMAGYDEKVHRGLVATNWIRTVGWSARAVMLLVVVGRLVAS